MVEREKSILMFIKDKDKGFVLQENIDLSVWKTKQQIMEELLFIGISIDERSLRLVVDYNNVLFNQHLRDTYIAHSNKGYIATKDEKIIKDSITDLFKRSKNMLWKYGQTRKAINENYNLKLELEESGLFEKEEEYDNLSGKG